MQREQQPVGQIVCYALVLLVAYLVSTTTAPLQILGYRIGYRGGYCLRYGFDRY